MRLLIVPDQQNDFSSSPANKQSNEGKKHTLLDGGDNYRIASR